MVRLILLLTLALLIQGCAGDSRTSNIRYYQLDSALFNNNLLRTDEQTQHLLRLSPISLRGNLNNRAMVVRRSPQEIYSANYHFWADSPALMLESSAQLQLMATLEQVLVVKGADVYAEQLQSSFYQLDIDIDHFNGGLNNNAEIAGLWRLSRVDEKGKLHVLSMARFSQSEPLAQDGYAALASALSKAWQTSLTEIANALPQHFNQG